MTANLEVLGWFVAAVFMLLLKSLYAATQKIYRFSSERDKLNLTINSIKRAVENNNASPPWPEHLTEGLREGEELIEKCSTVNIWNVFGRFWYSHKLTVLEDSLSKSFHDAKAALSFQQRRRFLEEVSRFVERTNKMAMLQEISTETGEAVSNGFEQSLPREREMLYADGAHAGLQLDESLPDIASPFYINVLQEYQDSDSRSKSHF